MIDGPEVPPDVAARFAEEDELVDAGDQLPLNGHRPEVRMSTELAVVIDHAVSAMCVDPAIFAREGTLVHAVRTSSAEAEASSVVVNGERRTRFIEGTPRIRDLSAATLRERLTRVARFTKWTAKSGWVSALPVDALVQGLHARGEWNGVRELVGVIETPSMRPDGSLIQSPGYDAATRFLYSPGAAFSTVPEAPTLADAARALADLCEVFVDFPFASEAARYVPIAALLTLVARPAIVGAVPAFLFDAPTPGTGKSLCSDAVCMVATGRGAPRGTFPIQPEELEKVLAAYALRSATVVGFDNIEGGLGGAALDKCLTAHDTVDFRVLGRSEMITMRWLAVVLASGNNIAVQKDTVRRILIARLESNEERPEEREGFRHSPLLPWVLAERPRLVVAALTLLRAFVLAGRPSMGRTWGSFESWADLVASAIVWGGGANVLDARPSQDAGDNGERGAMLGLLSGLSRLSPDDGITSRQILQLLYQDRDPQGPPDGYDDLREAIETLAPPRPGQSPDPRRFGEQIRRYRNRVVGGRRLVGKPDRNGVQRWKVEVVQ